MYGLNGYSLFRADRQDNFGGGVALYVTDNATHTPLNYPMTSAESIWIKIAIDSFTLTVACIYRPPRSNTTQFCKELDANIRAARADTEHILLLGDFNAKNSIWLDSDQTDRLGDDLHTLFSAHNLTQHVNFATHIHQHNLHSCIDLAVTSFERHNVTIDSVPPLGASDHLTISGKINHRIPRAPNVSSRDTMTYWHWSEQSIKSLRHSLKETDLSFTPTIGDPTPVNSMWNHWRTTLLQAAKRHCSKTRSTPRSNVNNVPPRPWISKDLLREIKAKHHMFRLYVKSKSETDWRRFTQQRNLVTSLLRHAKSDFINNSAGQNLHRLMKHFRKPAKHPIPTLKTRESTAATPFEQATLLNQFFISQSQQSVTKDDEAIPPIQTHPNITTTLATIQTTAKEVENLLRDLDISKSPGFDGIPTRILKETAEEIAPLFVSSV